MFERNQANGRSAASSVGAVGAKRASIGLPMKVMEAGRAASPSSAMSAAAAITAGPGWHTATTCVRGPSTVSMLRMCSTKSWKSNRPSPTGTSRALHQSVTYTSWSCRKVCTVPRSRVA